MGEAFGTALFPRPQNVALSNTDFRCNQPPGEVEKDMADSPSLEGFEPARDCGYTGEKGE